jgi:4-hydroxy-4-methyl-2-oxoglutarate aldolase
MDYLTLEQLNELREFDTPTIWNALVGYNLRSNIEGFTYPGVVLRTPHEKPMVGYAVTAKISGLEPATADQKEMMFTYFDDIRKTDGPSIAVMQDIDERPIGSFWGEVQATTFKALGAVGTITAGGIRDVDEVSKLGFYFFSTEMMVARAESHIVATDCPVEICGMKVRPGDLIHADKHGATVIPFEAAPTLANACRRVVKAESFVIGPCRQAILDGLKPTVDELRRWRSEMAKSR